MGNFSYTAMAIETASKSSKSICRIAFVAFDKRGQKQASESIYIKPPGKTFSFSSTNGITAADVANAPSFKEAWPRIASYVDGATVAVHFSSFAIKCLSACLKDAGITGVSCQILDTHSLGKAMFPDLVDYTLDSVSSEAYGHISQNTNTLSKAMAIADIVSYAAENSPRKIKGSTIKAKLS